MRLPVLIGTAIALAAATCATASSRYALAPTNVCLTRHHLLLTPHRLAWAVSIGMPVTSIESFVFTGVPAGVVDSGTLLLAPTAAAAKQADQAYFDHYVRYDVKTLHMKRRDIVTALKAEDYVIGNAVVQWNNYPQTAVAKRVLRGCLR